MNGPRYLPAIRTKVHSLRLGRVSVRTCDDRELGKLAGFVIDPRGHQVLSLVVEGPPTRDRSRWNWRSCLCDWMSRRLRCD